MKKLKIPAALALTLAACSSSSEEKTSEGDDQSAPAAVDFSATFYIHCVGRDVNLRNYQPPISLSYEVTEAHPKLMKVSNNILPGYINICQPNQSKCDVTINGNQIVAEADDGASAKVRQSLYVYIDRITGEFNSSQIVKSDNVRTTIYSAVGKCKKSSSPNAPSAI